MVAAVAELAYAHGSEPCLARGRGSSPLCGTFYCIKISRGLYTLAFKSTLNYH